MWEEWTNWYEKLFSIVLKICVVSMIICMKFVLSWNEMWNVIFLWIFFYDMNYDRLSGMIFVWISIDDHV